MTNENLPSCRAKKGLSGSPHEPRNTAWHAISIHKLGLYPLNWVWRPPRAAELLGAACGGLLALISLREIKPSSPGADRSLPPCIWYLDVLGWPFGRSRDWRPQGADFFDLESPRASHGAPRGSRITKGVEGNEMVAIWPEKNGPVLQQCTCGVPPRSYFAQ